MLEGYKNTEIGVIPKDWEVSCIEGIVSLNGIVRGPFGGSLKKECFVKSGYKVYEQKNAIYSTLLLGRYFIDEKKYKSLKRFKVNAGDFIISCSGTIGKIFRIPSVFEKGIINQALLKLTVNEDVIFPQYFYYQFIDDKFQKIVIDDTQGGAMKNLVGISEFKKSSFPLPQLSEQQAIAEVLSDTDELIHALEKRIAKKRNIKQGAMQKLLTPKEGWETKKLGDLIHSFQNGYGFSAKGYIKNGTPIVTMAQIGLDGSFQYNPNKVNRWRQTDFDSLKSFHLIDGDVIIAMTDVTPQKNLIGRMTIVRTDETLLLNQRVGHLRIDNTKVNPIVLCTLSNMKNWRYYSISSASLGVQANIRTKDILNGLFTLPKIEEQNKIATIFSDMDKELKKLEEKLDKYKNIKQGLMQQLLTGKIRLV